MKSSETGDTQGRKNIVGPEERDYSTPMLRMRARKIRRRGMADMEVSRKVWFHVQQEIRSFIYVAMSCRKSDSLADVC